ncbi:hypothetical protein O181_118131, partial [Austropuccinia psidii MF-1]|nr:hypothetical protein [Austropuccinia psidii MF-1]
TLPCKGTNQRTEKAFPEPEDLEEDTLDTVVDGKTLREIIPTSAPPTSERFISMQHGKEEVQPGMIDFKELMEITKGRNPTRQFRLLEVRANSIKENEATIQAIEEQLTQTRHTQIPSGSQGAGQFTSPVASNCSETNISVAKSHPYSQSQEVSRRIQG